MGVSSSWPSAIKDLQVNKLGEALENLRSSPQDEWTMLPGFVFRCSEISQMCQLPESEVAAVLASFAVPQGDFNAEFKSISAASKGRINPGRDQGFVDARRIGRNDLCPCGSGLKYKKCHGSSI